MIQDHAIQEDKRAMKAFGSKYLKIPGIVLLLLLANAKLQAQQVIHIRGRVIDKYTGHALPFANIVLVGKHNGTVADYNGYYEMDVKRAAAKIEARLLGYQDQVKPVSPKENQVINFMLKPQRFNLNEIVIAGKKIKYRNKGNPAVALIKKVIKNKNLNRLKSLDTYQYDKYNKIEFDFNNINEDKLQSGIFRGFRSVSHFAEKSGLNGKLNIPVYLKETAFKVYYRKSPRRKKEYITGIKMTGLPDFIDKQGVGLIIDRLFKNVDIYDNNILLLTNQFVSPLSVIAPEIYKFRILDTLNVNGYSCIDLAFQPRNKADFAFGGNLYITNDNRYAVVKAVMRIRKGINLNFVKNLQIVQEFKFFGHKIWALSKDQTIVDFFITGKGIGMEGKKTDFYDHYIFNKKQNDSVYAGIKSQIILPRAESRNRNFWKENRISPLQPEEKNIYVMMDSLQHTASYKRGVNILMLLVGGYWNFGKIDLGPVGTFYSFNSVEGRRLSLAARTSPKFSKYLRVSGSFGYGFKDQEYKYDGKALWSLNKIPLNERPTNTLSVTYQNDITFPGMEMQLVNGNNFFLSYKRGVANKILYYKLFEIQHYLRWGNDISTTCSVSHLEERPGGSWQFRSPGFPLDQLVSSEITAQIRFAPDERYYQGMDGKLHVTTRYPVFQLDLTRGFKNVWNSDYSYSRLSVTIFKRLYLGLFGFLDSQAEAGKVFGSRIPYPLLFVHHANQTYSYQPFSYNLMNFLEFVSDKYAAYFGEYHLNGFLFNQIPLFKHLKWRAVVTFKMLFGGLSDQNNPEKTPGLMAFPTDASGNPTTFTLKNKPYMEVGVGVENIFKLFRVDLIRRLTYLNNPHVNKYGFRVGFDVIF